MKLGVNIDHVAALRQSRQTRYPDPVQAALVAEQAGADAITVHLREDRRHIQERDVALLREVVTTRLNLEMAITDDMVALALVHRPADCCLVPERRAELTTEGGLDVAGDLLRVQMACARLQDAGIRVALFVDPERRQIEAAARAQAPVVELHTGTFATATGAARDREYARLVDAAGMAATLGLQVNAGHGLHYHNVAAVARIGAVAELNIGHAIIARALFTGLAAAVAEMKRLMVSARSP